jgi:uncharacterized membrane protein
MSDHLQHELKKEFQLERMILFSDAVFAIAITLLVLEIKLPNIDRHQATDELLLKSLDEQMPKFVGFFLSFMFIGLYWTIHHRIFGFVVDYDARLLWLNLYFLLAVVLMPFSTGLFSEYLFRMLKTPIIFYASNVIFLGVMHLVIWRYLVHPGRKLLQGVTPAQVKGFTVQAIVLPTLFLFTLMFYLFVSRSVAVYVPLLVALGIRLYRKKFLVPSPVKNKTVGGDTQSS